MVLPLSKGLENSPIMKNFSMYGLHATYRLQKSRILSYVLVAVNQRKAVEIILNSDKIQR